MKSVYHDDSGHQNVKLQFVFAFGLLYGPKANNGKENLKLSKMMNWKNEDSKSLFQMSIRQLV